MRQEEAARLLGLKPDSSLEEIKAAYKTISSDVNFVDQQSRERFHLISVAFSKMTIHWHTDENINSDEEIEEDDVHEMRAFMRMFMDLVGIFNEDRQNYSSAQEPIGFPIPPRLSKLIEDWSSDEEGDDDDESDEGSDESDYDEGNEEFSKRCPDKTTDGRAVDASDAESRRRLKNAKKRAEKRRKLKQKKQRDKSEGGKGVIEKDDDDQIESVLDHEEQMRLAEERERQMRVDLFAAVHAGSFDKFERLVTNADTAFTVNEKELLGSDVELGSLPLLHHCVSEHTVAGSGTATGRCKIARFLFAQKGPALDVAAVDNESRNILHFAAAQNDAAVITVVLSELELNADLKDVLSVNDHCHRLGWTPLHYAAEKGNSAACKALLHGGASLNVHALIINSKDGSAKAKGPTALELAKQRLKKPSNGTSVSALDAVVAELTRAQSEADKAKEQRYLAAQRKEKEEALERAQQKESHAKASIQTTTQVTPAITNVKTPVVIQDVAADVEDKAGAGVGKGKKRKKDKKKGADDKGASSSTADVAAAPVAVSSLAVATDLISRDEMLDGLINMGFPEADCMAAIVACGRNVDLAISWLLEKPPSSQDKSTPVTIPPKPIQAPPLVPVSIAKDSSVKEKDHKVELRRINKAWNQKAEDELKKQEQERRVKEQAKQQPVAQKPELHSGIASPPRPSVIPGTRIRAEDLFARSSAPATNFNSAFYQQSPTARSSTSVSPDLPYFPHAASASWNAVNARRSLGPPFTGLPDGTMHESHAMTGMNMDRGVTPPLFDLRSTGRQGLYESPSREVSGSGLNVGAKEFVFQEQQPTSFLSSPSRTESNNLGGFPLAPPGFSDSLSWPHSSAFGSSSTGWTPPSSLGFQSTSFGGLSSSLAGPMESKIAPDGLFSGFSRGVASQSDPFKFLEDDSFTVDDFDIPSMLGGVGARSSVSRLNLDGPSGDKNGLGNGFHFEGGDQLRK